MRVPTNSYSNTLINQLGQLSSRQQRLQTEAATGQKVQLPDDDPAGVRRVLDLQAEAKVVGQYRSNISKLQERSTTTYETTKSLKKISSGIILRQLHLLASRGLGLKALLPAA